MWQESDLRTVKRSLSRYEKHQIKDKKLLSGNALIFPGEPNTEIEELAHIGFSVDNIFCVEQDQDAANELHDYYYDRCRIFWEKSDAFLQKTSKRYSYAHLDYCGQFYSRTANDICLLSDHLAEKSFVRVTVYNARKSTSQKSFEFEVLSKLKELLADYDIYLTDETDSTNVFAMYTYLVLSYSSINVLDDFFNTNVLQLGCLKYSVKDLWIFEYKEPEASNKMSTVFFNLQKQEDCMGIDNFKTTLELLNLTPAYYVKGFEKES